MSELKQSRVALVVIKLKFRDTPYYLMRNNKAWGDVSFVGGHVDERDADSLERAAHRELLEEVPSLKCERSFDLNILTPQLDYGPVYSASAKTQVVYDLQFFLLLFHQTPESVITSLRKRSMNVLLAQSELLQPTRYKVATLVEILNNQYPGGLSAIPYSWPRNLESIGNTATQSILALK